MSQGISNHNIYYNEFSPPTLWAKTGFPNDSVLGVSDVFKETFRKSLSIRVSLKCVPKCAKWIFNVQNYLQGILQKCFSSHHHSFSYLSDPILVWEIVINTLRPRDMDAIFQTTFSNAFSSMKNVFLLKFHWSLFLVVQLTIFHHWFR